MDKFALQNDIRLTLCNRCSQPYSTLFPPIPRLSLLHFDAAPVKSAFTNLFDLIVKTETKAGFLSLLLLCCKIPKILSFPSLFRSRIFSPARLQRLHSGTLL